MNNDALDRIHDEHARPGHRPMGVAAQLFPRVALVFGCCFGWAGYITTGRGTGKAQAEDGELSTYHRRRGAFGTSIALAQNGEGQSSC